MLEKKTRHKGNQAKNNCIAFFIQKSLASLGAWISDKLFCKYWHDKLCSLHYLKPLKYVWHLPIKLTRSFLHARCHTQNNCCTGIWKSRDEKKSFLQKSAWCRVRRSFDWSFALTKNSYCETTIQNCSNCSQIQFPSFHSAISWFATTKRKNSWLALSENDVAYY